jgi:creatinine amidohydrolase
MSPDDPSVPDPLLLEHLTWPEVELALTRGTTTVVIPIGAVEQHGPHLPLCVDAERGAALGYRVARALGDALVGPTIRVGCSDHHMGFAGTISIRAETLEALCRDYCTSLAQHGFQEVYLVPSHGGNFKPLEEMVPRLQAAVDEVSADCRVVAYTDLLGIIAVWRWVVEEEVGLGRRVGGHADIAESSEILHLHPGLVRVERAEKGTVGELNQDLVDRVFEKGLRAIAPNGILGDARGMDAALGERLLDATARVIAQAFREEGGPPGPGSGGTPAGSAVPFEEGIVDDEPYGDEEYLDAPENHGYGAIDEDEELADLDLDELDEALAGDGLDEDDGFDDEDEPDLDDDLFRAGDFEDDEDLDDDDPR